MFLFLLAALRAIVEMLGYCLLAQALLYLLAGKKRLTNPIYQLFSLITQAPRKLCARFLPSASSEVVVGISCFVILVVLWIGLAWLRGVIQTDVELLLSARPSIQRRSLEMSKPLMSDEELVRRLGAHPDLRSRIEALVLAVEDETGELKTADAAEMRVIEMMRRTGHDALQSWAQHQVEKTTHACKQTSGVWSEGKKNSAGTPPLATSALMSPNAAKAQKESAPSRKAPKSATVAARARSSAQ
jgi:hypothetical protein